MRDAMSTDSIVVSELVTDGCILLASALFVYNKLAVAARPGLIRSMCKSVMNNQYCGHSHTSIHVSI